MVDFETNQPTFYWTLESVVDYKSKDDAVWKADRLGTPVVTNEEISVDYFSEDWEPRYNPMRLTLEADGYYHSRNRPEWGNVRDHHYYGLKSESATHMFIVGHWFDEGFGRGMFIAVFPKDLK